MAGAPDMDRRAAVLAAVRVHAECGTVVPIASAVATSLGLNKREYRRQLALLERDGALAIERRGSGLGQALRIVLPGGVLASAWSPTWEPRDGAPGSSTRRILALITDAAQAGAPAPTNGELAAMVGVDAGHVQSAIANLAYARKLTVERDGTAHAGTRVFVVGAWRSAPGSRRGDTSRATERAEPATVATEPKRPVQPLIARRLPRCPFCELPADHHLCRHGWNGMTTRGQRAAIAGEVGSLAA